MERIFSAIPWITFKIYVLTIRQSLFFKRCQSIMYVLAFSGFLFFLWRSGILISSLNELFVR